MVRAAQEIRHIITAVQVGPEVRADLVVQEAQVVLATRRDITIVDREVRVAQAARSIRPTPRITMADLVVPEARVVLEVLVTAGS